MHFIVCDDDPAFARQLCGMIEDCCARQNWPCSCQAADGPAALAQTDLTGADALFLDIEMPRTSGLDAARRLRERYPELLIVFVTSFIQYAPAGYEVQAFRYLLKSELDARLPRCLADIREELAAARRAIQVRTADGQQFVLLRPVVYMEGTARRHILLHLTSGGRQTRLECIGLLSELEGQLAGAGFLRIQRSYLVNMAHIEKITNYYAYLSTGEALKVSVQNYREVCRQFLLWKGRHLL